MKNFVEKWWRTVVLLLATLILTLGGWNLVKSAFIESFNIVQFPVIGFVVFIFQLGFAVMAFAAWVLTTLLVAIVTLREALIQIRR